MGRALSREGVVAFTLFAQQPQGITLHGTVVAAETGEPLPFSIVSLRPGVAEHFTDQAGAFTFSGLPSGIYRLLVRQIGYAPAETTFAVGAEADISIRIALSRVAVELPPLTVTGELTCAQPGPPDATVTPALAAVFDQLLENARRYRLLADSFPFTFVLERALTSTGERREVDTIRQKSVDERRGYRPGRVVDAGTGAWRDQRVVLWPGLEELADSAFVSNHCFRLAGRDTTEGETLVRVDFEPAARLRSSDVGGAAYLDPMSYQLRYARVRLTRPARTLPGTVGLVATIRFREIAPGIVLQDYVRGVTTLPGRMERIEEQRLLAVHFLRPFVEAPKEKE
ncbi:MAG TPA: carboxypeptidase regulatory-like domain-containing protein [Gemmatimonadales bacterium]|nr:carboxypeptidase regulatory-like domain-containing protein [Gemmatimonadales bacterium]